MPIIRSPDPRLAPEIRWFLRSRGIPWPDCPPKILTPSPGDAEGAVFDPGRVDRVLDVFSRLRHTQGEWAGRPLKLDPWQVAYLVAPIFGWVAQDDRGNWARVVRKALIDIPRKNGKTSTAGGIAVYMTCADDEPGAQVYAVAAGKDQARFCFDPIKALAEKSPDLSPYMRVTRDRLVHRPSGSYFGVVSSTADLLHGANVHGAIVDELHVHRTPDVVEAVETGTGSRRQPLVAIITTSDEGRQGTIYARKRERLEQLARGAIVDPTTYGAVWGAEESDDPFVEATWRKANPGYGISPTRSYMAAAAAEAQQSPADLAKFLRLHLGIRTKQETRYLDLAAWDTNLAEPAEPLEGRECFGGLDLSTTSDLCALAWDFPDWRGGHDVLWRLWAPEAALVSLNKRTAGMAQVWVREGLLDLTPGNVADYDYIRQRINQDRALFRVREIAYDPWNSSQLVNDLVADGAAMVPVRQGFATMSPPTKEIKRLLLEGCSEGAELRYRHGSNACIRWQIDNFAVEMDAAGNVKPSKAKAGDKIDGIVAGIMALDRAMRNATEVSIYETESMTFF